MAKATDVLTPIVLALATASTSPWWWDKVFPAVPKATAEEDHQESDLSATGAYVPEPRVVARAVNSNCEGLWFVQVAVSTDREAQVRFVDSLRRDGFSDATLYKTTRDKYASALGCYARHDADAIRDDLAERLRGRTSTPPLVTKGVSLAQKVH